MQQNQGFWCAGHLWTRSQFANYTVMGPRWRCLLFQLASHLRWRKRFCGLTFRYLFWLWRLIWRLKTFGAGVQGLLHRMLFGVNTSAVWVLLLHFCRHGRGRGWQHVTDWQCRWDGGTKYKCRLFFFWRYLYFTWLFPNVSIIYLFILKLLSSNYICTHICTFYCLQTAYRFAWAVIIFTWIETANQ